MVDHPVLGPLGHHAATQGVYRHKVVSQQLVPGRIGHIGAAQGPGRIQEGLVDPGEDGLPAGGRPLDPQTVVFEHHPPGTVIKAHDEKGLRLIDRAMIRPTDEGFPLALLLSHRIRQAAVGITPGEAACRAEDPGQHAGEGARDRALLDDHAILQLIPTAQIDDASDAGTHRRPPPGRATAKTDAVHGPVVVVGKAQHIAVAGEPVAYPIGEGQAPLFRAQENLGRAEGSGA